MDAGGRVEWKEGRRRKRVAFERGRGKKLNHPSSTLFSHRISLLSRLVSLPTRGSSNSSLSPNEMTRSPFLLLFNHHHLNSFPKMAFSQVVKVEYDPKDMIFSRLGSSGLQVSKFSLGSWLVVEDSNHSTDLVKEIMRTAFLHGINSFDTAENYANGESEIQLGRIVRELGWRRSDLVIGTKVFFGVGRKGPNDTGLSRKHVIEGINESLERLDMDYVDIAYAHRPDSSVPMEEVVRAFNFLIDQGKALYWGTSEWSAVEIAEAHHVASKLRLLAPFSEQPQYSMLTRDRVEVEYAPLLERFGLGCAIWSPLARGMLTGKYNNGIPENSRYAGHAERFANDIDALKTPEGLADIERVKKLTIYAKEKLDCSPTHLALAWAAVNPLVSTVILGASKPEQVVDNLRALKIIPKLTPQILEEIEEILGNKTKVKESER